MKKSGIFLAVGVLAVSMAFITCNEKSGPTTPSTPINPPPDPTAGQIIVSEGFENDSIFRTNYRVLSFEPGKMSISAQNPHSGTHSLTSDSNKTSIACQIDPAIGDSIAGLQFYLKATKHGQNLIVAMCKTGSSPSGLWTTIGMGIDKSDSLRYVYEDNPDAIINEHKNFAKLTLNKWYKCRVEYDYTDTTLTYYVDDAVVRTRTAPSPMTLPTFVVMRDSLGTQESSGCYLDDIMIFKR
jgi:hypothetical protein